MKHAVIFYVLFLVQAPLSGVDVMKDRLHVANFTSTFATALVLYNSNDSHFISQVNYCIGL